MSKVDEGGYCAFDIWWGQPPSLVHYLSLPSLLCYPSSAMLNNHLVVNIWASGQAFCHVARFRSDLLPRVLDRLYPLQSEKDVAWRALLTTRPPDFHDQQRPRP